MQTPPFYLNSEPILVNTSELGVNWALKQCRQCLQINGAVSGHSSILVNSPLCLALSLFTFRHRDDSIFILRVFVMVVGSSRGDTTLLIA